MATEPTNSDSGNSEVDGGLLNFFWRGGNGSPTVVSSQIPVVEFESYTYNVSHKNRGIALIFNHEVFNNTEMKPREGTYKDKKDLVRVLEKLDFEVRAYDDLKYGQLDAVLKDVSSMDHSHNDCLLVVVMSHGEDGQIHARDHTYPPDVLWEPFTGDRCVSLAGKPKLFFIQACRGDKVDDGAMVRGRTEFDFGRAEDVGIYKVPVMADILVMYSTYQGYFSWRSPDKGSWFIQALCTELDLNGSKLDLLNLLTFVNRRVSLQHQSNVPGSPAMHKKKQVCTIVSMLTRIMYFPPKQFQEEKMAVDAKREQRQGPGRSGSGGSGEVIKVTAKIVDRV